MSVKINAVMGTTGIFTARSISGGKILAGASGDIISLTPPVGQRVKLTHLSTVAGDVESNMTVTIGTTDVTGVVAIDGNSPTGAGVITIGSYQAYPAGNPPATNFLQLTGKVNEVVKVTKNAGNTSFDVFYGYEFGE